jgi:CRISPR-associated protein Csb1
LPALRRLRFPITRTKKGTNEQEIILDPRIDDAARTVLAALGLCAAVLSAEAGLDLRSRCLLWPTAPLSWELLGKPGVKEEGVILETDEAIQLLKAAIDVATSTEMGLPWRTDPLRLVPSPDLVKLVVKSQQLALAQGSEGGE